MRYRWQFGVVVCFFIPLSALAAPSISQLPRSIPVGDLNHDGEEDLAIINANSTLRIVAQSNPRVALREFPLVAGDAVTAVTTQVAAGSDRPLVVAHVVDRSGKKGARVYSFRAGTPLQIVVEE